MLRRTAGEVDAFFVGGCPVYSGRSSAGRPAAVSEKEILLHLDEIAYTKSDSTRQPTRRYARARPSTDETQIRPARRFPSER